MRSKKRKKSQELMISKPLAWVLILNTLEIKNLEL
jgi:hypothetical protein